MIRTQCAHTTEIVLLDGMGRPMVGEHCEGATLLLNSCKNNELLLCGTSTLGTGLLLIFGRQTLE